jgi:hypothetical protein
MLALRQLDAAATAYMGDDVVLPVLRRCGLALTVAGRAARGKATRPIARFCRDTAPRARLSIDHAARPCLEHALAVYLK